MAKIGTRYKANSINHVTRGIYTYFTDYIKYCWHVSLKKYGHHTANICHTAPYSPSSTSHVTATYVPETNMATKLDIYAKYLKVIYRVYAHVCHIRNQ